MQKTYSKPQDEPIQQIDWRNKNQAVFNSNAEISRKTDAGTAILLTNPVHNSTMLGKIVEAEY